MLNGFGDRGQVDALCRRLAQETGYTTSAFLRAKLGEALLEHGGAPRIFKSATDARRQLPLLHASSTGGRSAGS